MLMMLASMLADRVNMHDLSTVVQRYKTMRLCTVHGLNPIKPDGRKKWKNAWQNLRSLRCTQIDYASFQCFNRVMASSFGCTKR
ncbi:hypothetical protein Plhal304r1_c009g0037831 [Plasmopara halstedii]